MTTLEEVEAVFLAEKHRWSDTVIGLFRGIDDNRHMIAKLTAEPGELIGNLSYRLYGQLKNTKYGDQFDTKTFVRSQPHGQAGVVRYLQEAPGIGQAVAKALWAKFGSDAVRIVRETPEVAAEVVNIPNWPAEKARISAKFLVGEQRLESCSIDLVDLLGGRGFPKLTPQRAVKRWGNKAAEFIRRNPYILMKLPGCGFLRADKLYLDLGHNPNRLKRQALCIWHHLDSDNEGHTWHRIADVMRGLRGKVSGATIDGPRAVKLAKRAGILSVYRDSRDELYLAESIRAAHESQIASLIALATKETSQWPEITEGITAHQAENLHLATTGTIGILGGSPGTGKTYTTAKLIGHLLDLVGEDEVAVCAPTGKAAVRITEAMASNGVNVQAMTLHRLLGVRRGSGEEDQGTFTSSFEHNQDNPLNFGWIFVDEMSMTDTDIVAALLSARAPGTHILFIGDVNQLPPVGHGAPLRDLITAGIPYGELREIQRNSGTIVRACHQIRDNIRFETDDILDPETGKNLKIVPAGENPSQTIERILSIMTRNGLCDPIWDAQVIVAVNEKSALSRKDLNKSLQGHLNPRGKSVGKNPYRVGDKIVCLKNGFYKGEDDEEIFLANGEVGKVLEVEEKRTIATFAGKRIGFVTTKEEAGGDFDLAYALSCHKCQGSEVPIAIIALDDYPGAKMVCDRAWLYTAASRAKQVCVMVGKRSTADAMCAKNFISRRKTFLVEKIKGKRK